MAAIRSAHAAQYPEQTVRYINLFPPGAATDLLSRAYCATMSTLAGEQFVVENKSGAGGTVGQAAIAQSPPDGYTLGLGSIASLGIAPSIYPSLPYDPARDFTYVAGIWQVPNLLFCNAAVPVRSLQDMVALVKANPGKYLYGSGGSGTSPHLTMEWLKQVAGLNLAHVPYRGGAPMLLDLIAGRVHFAFDNLASLLAPVRQGQIRPLAVTSKERSPLLPDVPTTNSVYPELEITSWGGLVGPARIPAQIVERLADLTHETLKAAELNRIFREQGATPWWLPPEEFAAFQQQQQRFFAGLVKRVGASAN
ncbi:Bug family tripartite tricarboxylate transporter substrate binding protein [Dankookia rubra]|nr:tripartite tricarboxylate transporter substrate binding protein [Dankookia rubra]